ncbi:hypothetical protein MESS4_750213 [Mesorhizobium sp. STM 4661]|nr:hypothetical protein MESS4_750213 [Mesorhizobium sp. STM 4661]
MDLAAIRRRKATPDTIHLRPLKEPQGNLEAFKCVGHRRLTHGHLRRRKRPELGIALIDLDA